MIYNVFWQRPVTNNHRLAEPPAIGWDIAGQYPKSPLAPVYYKNLPKPILQHMSVRGDPLGSGLCRPLAGVSPSFTWLLVTGISQLKIRFKWSARCECVFSSLMKVDAPQRRRQITRRVTDLTFIYFERKHWWRSNPRTPLKNGNQNQES